MNVWVISQWMNMQGRTERLGSRKAPRKRGRWWKDRKEHIQTTKGVGIGKLCEQSRRFLQRGHIEPPTDLQEHGLWLGPENSALCPGHCVLGAVERRGVVGAHQLKAGGRWKGLMATLCWAWFDQLSHYLMQYSPYSYNVFFPILQISWGSETDASLNMHSRAHILYWTPVPLKLELYSPCQWKNPCQTPAPTSLMLNM